MTAKTDKSTPKKKGEKSEKTNVKKIFKIKKWNVNLFIFQEEKINEIIADGGTVIKMEVDYSETCDEKIPKAEELASKVKSVLILNHEQ